MKKKKNKKNITIKKKKTRKKITKKQKPVKTSIEKRKKEVRSWVVSIVTITILLIVAKHIVPEKQAVTEKTPVMINLQQGIDFPNEKEGTFSIGMTLNHDMIKKEAGMIPDYLILFSSKKIPGLTLKYNLKENSIEGGLPLITANNIALLDGKNHRVDYMFKKDHEQKIFVDGQEVASGDFGKGMSFITGNTIFYETKTVLIDVPVTPIISGKLLN